MAVLTLLNDVEIADGIAKTITAAITSELHEHQLRVDNLSTLSADGATTFSGHKTGVGVQLRQVNLALMFYHCLHHRLALQLLHCKNSCQDADTGQDRPDTRGTEQVLQDTRGTEQVLPDTRGTE